ncbi:FAD-dependent monooxygenase [Agrobacterium bohemicum]|uniref:FAD-dependent monooxygenase n=1 Tax=Agrobacterium bohemicum TaxID=2052828 RepID=UPI000B07A7C0|nr:FAD-dependent monooxygenase [Agrobacterium bohemicum]
MEKTLQIVGRGSSVLISGASFAGLSTAYWLNELGYDVTIVEVGNGLKYGGSPVDIRDGSIDVIKRMGLYERIRARSLKPRRLYFKNACDVAVATISPETGEGPTSGEEYEIERDTLLETMFEALGDEIEVIFGDSISSLEQNESQVRVSFKSGEQRTFSLVIGCDGNHSSIRKMVFGPESDYAVSLQNYFGISIVNKLLIETDTTQIYNAPGKAVMLNAYNHKTDISFLFFSADEIRYDYRDQDQHRRIIHEQFFNEKWRTREVLEEALQCENFYFDKFCQIKMPSWSKGRVALVGDAAYCATPAAGMGGALAMVGATALADALIKYEGNAEMAFQEYDRSLRPFVEKVQANAIGFGLEMFAPRTEKAIRERNARFASS